MMERYYDSRLVTAEGLRELEVGNLKLKHLLAEAELNKAALKELVEEKW